ncbi:MAG: class I SAM-dependent methyltransferase [Deltaproteobacteria bacterium]|nr:class I SAM-dependent methyltransferase [Deltaproteobacteria bacterium]
MSKKRSKQIKKRNKTNPKNLSILNAFNADKHILYQQSVQDTETTINFINEVYFDTAQKYPKSLREDFCGTALLASAFAADSYDKTSCGLDLDQNTLNWGLKHNILPLGDGASRVKLLNKNVLEGTPDDKFDTICAFNFSYCVFKERKTILKYFKQLKTSLNKKGLFILDLHGGPDAQFQLTEPATMEEFEYIWEQESFDPITHETICHIHFAFNDGSRMDKAFTYDWRYWSLPELKDILAEAGFKHIDVWWNYNNGNEDFEKAQKAENMESWIAYLAAWN